jgi:hypothetical protein
MIDARSLLGVGPLGAAKGVAAAAGPVGAKGAKATSP